MQHGYDSVCRAVASRVTGINSRCSTRPRVAERYARKSTLAEIALLHLTAASQELVHWLPAEGMPCRTLVLGIVGERSKWNGLQSLLRADGGQ